MKNHRKKLRSLLLKKAPSSILRALCDKLCPTNGVYKKLRDKRMVQPNKDRIIEVIVCSFTQNNMRTILEVLLGERNVNFCIDFANYVRCCEEFEQEKHLAEKLIAKITEKKTRPKSKGGYVYLLEESLHKYVKIGRTKDLSVRLTNFGVKLPFTVSVIHVIYCEDEILTEKLLHEKFIEKRVDGEWFRLSRNDICDIKNHCISQDIIRAITGEFYRKPGEVTGSNVILREPPEQRDVSSEEQITPNKKLPYPVHYKFDTLLQIKDIHPTRTFQLNINNVNMEKEFILQFGYPKVPLPLKRDKNGKFSFCDGRAYRTYVAIKELGLKEVEAVFL